MGGRAGEARLAIGPPEGWGEGGEGGTAALRSPAGGRGSLRTRDGRCDLHAPSLLMTPPLLPPGWEPGLPRLLPAMSLGMSGLGGRVEGDVSVIHPSHFGKMGWVGSDGGVIWLNPWAGQERESRIWGVGYRSEVRKTNRREALAGIESLVVRSPPASPSLGSPGSVMRCLQSPSLPPGAAETLSLQPILGSKPKVRREWEGEGPGTTFWLGKF